MEAIEIPMIPEGEEGNVYRTKLPDGETFHTLLMKQGNHGTAVKSQARIVKIVSGTYRLDGDPATLLIFELQFQSPSPRRRFTNAEIIAEFEDAGSQRYKPRDGHKLDPVVIKISPQGDFALNKGTSTSAITKNFTAEVSGGLQGLTNGKLGYTWEIKKNVSQEHSASLSGTPSNQRENGSGEENAAIWWLYEDPKTKQGIPRLLRTAVLLRLPHARPFNVSLTVKTDVDMITEMLTFWGVGQSEAIDPVTIPHAFQFNADIDADLLAQMDDLDLTSYTKVAFVSPMDSD